MIVLEDKLRRGVVQLDPEVKTILGRSIEKAEEQITSLAMTADARSVHEKAKLEEAIESAKRRLAEDEAKRKPEA